MDKDLHDIDDIFNKAQQRYTEEPTEAAWEKIGAVLDKDDAEKYKKRFIGWKRIAIVLLLLHQLIVVGCYNSHLMALSEMHNQIVVEQAGLQARERVPAVSGQLQPRARNPVVDRASGEDRAATPADPVGIPEAETIR